MKKNENQNFEFENYRGDLHIKNVDVNTTLLDQNISILLINVLCFHTRKRWMANTV